MRCFCLRASSADVKKFAAQLCVCFSGPAAAVRLELRGGM